MDIFGMGMGEVLLILVVALIIWGPGKIPEIARTLGKTVRSLRKATSDLTTVVTKELDIEGKDHPPQSKANSDDKTSESSNAGKTESSDPKTASPRH